MMTKHFNKGEVIILEGSMGDQSYRVLSGEIIICKESRKKGLIPIAKLQRGDLFGEMYLLDQHGKRCATAIAATDADLEIYSKQEMQDQLRAISPEIQAMMRTMQNRLKKTSQNYTFVKAIANASPQSDTETIEPEEEHHYESRKSDGIIFRNYTKHDLKR